MSRINLLLISFIGVFTIISQSNCLLVGRLGIPSLLTIPETLNSFENVSSHERILNNSVHIDKLGTKFDNKMTINNGKEIKRTKRFETTLKNSEELIVIKSNGSSSKHNTSMGLSHLRNVVLILVDTSRQIGDEFWNNFTKTNSFPVHGYFEIENQEESGPMKIELNKFIFSEKKEDECECKKTLRSRISELLIWAHQVKEMTTSILTAFNFSIPFVSDIEGDVDVGKEIESNKNIKKERIYKREFIQNDSLSSFNLMDGNYTNVEKKDYVKDFSNYGNIWDVFDFFAKIKIAFFRAIIDCLNGSTNKTDDEFSLQESSYLRTSYIDLVETTMKNLKTISDNKGYMLVLVIPENELTSVIELLHYEISPSDTLIIVTELCSKDIKRVSFFADGPEASSLYRIKMIEELPYIIKSFLNRSCQEKDCHNLNQNYYDIPIRISRTANDSKFLHHINNSIETKLENISKRFLNNTHSDKIDVSSGISKRN